MNVSLTPELEKLINEKVDSGLYQTASEVVREALRLLRERDQDRDQLRADVQAGFGFRASRRAKVTRTTRRPDADWRKVSRQLAGRKRPDALMRYRLRRGRAGPSGPVDVRRRGVGELRGDTVLDAIFERIEMLTTYPSAGAEASGLRRWHAVLCRRKPRHLLPRRGRSPLDGTCSARTPRSPCSVGGGEWRELNRRREDDDEG